MYKCKDCGYMRIGFDGFCERCASRRVKPLPPKKASYRNRSLDELRSEDQGGRKVTYKLPPDEPRVAVSHDDYLEFLRRMQTLPMTEGEVADLVIRRLESVAAGQTPQGELVYEVKELCKLSEAWISEAQAKRIASLVIKYVSRWSSTVPSEA